MIRQNYNSFPSDQKQPYQKRTFLTRRIFVAILLPLICGALSVVGINQTSAATTSKQIPYKDSYVLQLVSNINNPGGTQDQVYLGQGTNTIGGSFTVIS